MVYYSIDRKSLKLSTTFKVSYSDRSRSTREFSHL